MYLPMAVCANYNTFFYLTKDTIPTISPTFNITHTELFSSTFFVMKIETGRMLLATHRTRKFCFIFGKPRAYF